MIKKRREIITIEVGITSQNQLTIVENENKRIIHYVLTLDWIVTNFHKTYTKEIGLTTKIQSYIQFIVLKKTLESIPYEYKKNSQEIIPEKIVDVEERGYKEIRE